MKKILLFICAILCLSVTSSCNDEKDEKAPDSLFMYSNTATVEVAAGTHSVTIYTTCAWEASADTWLTIDPVKGGEKGIHVVKLSYDANTTGSERSGNVVFKAGTYSETFTLIQKAK